jgi:hypothetical protein
VCPTRLQEPALKAKVADHVWSFEELVELIDSDLARRAREQE